MATSTRTLKLSFKNDKGTTVTKTFNNAKAKNDIDESKLAALMDSMIENTTIFTANLVQAHAAAVVTTTIDEFDL